MNFNGGVAKCGAEADEFVRTMLPRQSKHEVI